MDFSPFASPKHLRVAPDGTYQLPLEPEFPLLLRWYRFSQPHPAVPNHHECLEISIILKGSGRFTIGGRTYAANRGDIFALSNRTFHLLEADDDKLENLSLYFMPELIHVPGASDVNLEYLLLFAREQQRFSAKVSVDRATAARVLEIMGFLAEALVMKAPFYRIAAKNCLCTILHLLDSAAALSPGDADQVHLRLRDINRLQPVFERIHERYAEKLALADLAKVADMSVTHLCRYFKRVTGRTMTDYVKRYRIDRAKTLLVGDEHSITWIAYEVGFESHSYFDRIFHDVTRMTPQEFRRRYARRMSVDDGLTAPG
jgi:AraC-like DNA-binding protein/mannose-6-phosphate isomerase-like protein (cupin superfamily)